MESETSEAEPAALSLSLIYLRWKDSRIVGMEKSTPPQLLLVRASNYSGNCSAASGSPITETKCSLGCPPCTSGIDGEVYWDGGYMGNPALFPLIDETDAHDLIIIQSNPIVRDELPRSAPERLSMSSQFNAEWEFLDHLHRIGYAAAERWITTNIDRVGRESTIDRSSIYFSEMKEAACGDHRTGRPGDSGDE